MNSEQVVILMRCLELGIRAAADAFEKETQPVNPYDTSAFDTTTVKVMSDKDMLKYFSKEQLIQVLSHVDPGFDCSSLGMAGLKARLAEVAGNPVVTGSKHNAAVISNVFSPPGVIAGDDAVAAGTKLTEFFEDVLKTNEDFVRAYQTRQQCDLRCVRPGGACPNSIICMETLT